MARRILIGSANADKAAELRELLRGMDWTVLSLDDVEDVVAPEETGATFDENAVLKAKYYGRLFGLPCVADDSGLEVDALNGAPGVYSARYAGPSCSYADNNAQVLRELTGASDGARTARFVCSAAFYDPMTAAVHVERGQCEGRIAESPQGTHGFGYDPIFIPNGYSETFGELAADVKHSLSHRGEAFRKMRDHLAGLG